MVGAHPGSDVTWVQSTLFNTVFPLGLLLGDCFGTGVGLDDPQRSLPTPTIL